MLNNSFPQAKVLQCWACEWPYSYRLASSLHEERTASVEVKQDDKSGGPSKPPVTAVGIKSLTLKGLSKAPTGLPGQIMCGEIG